MSVMKDIEVRGIVKKRREERPTVFALLYLAAGLMGLLLLLHADEGTDFSLLTALLAGMAVLLFFWLGFYFLGRWFNLCLLAFLGGLGWYIFRFRESLFTELIAVEDRIILGSGADTARADSLAVLAAVFFVLILFLFEVLLRNHLIPFLLTTALLFAATLGGIVPPVLSVLLLLIYQVGMWLLGIVDYEMRDGSVGRLVSFRTIAALSGVTALILVTALGVSHFLVRNPDLWYERIYAAEDKAIEAVNRIMSRFVKPPEDGRLNSGNNYRFGNPYMELELEEAVRSPLYLRSFAGGAYTGSRWEDAADEELWEAAAEEAAEEYAPDTERPWESMALALNEELTGAEPNRIYVVNSGNDADSRYVPYFSEETPIAEEEQTTELRQDPYAYSYRFFDRRDLDYSADDIEESDDDTVSWYEELSDAYLLEAEERYTEVNRDRLPRLAALVEEHPLTDPDEITAFILTTLHNNTQYTLTPGRTPVNEDRAEYFLFVSGKGFCEQYATTAALMYRLYGIPARYASGYRLYADEFTLGEDGQIRCEVTDYAAHAWVELYREGVGWTACEVTPAEDGAMQDPYPELTAKNVEEIALEQGFEVVIDNEFALSLADENEESGEEPAENGDEENPADEAEEDRPGGTEQTEREESEAPEMEDPETEEPEREDPERPEEPSQTLQAFYAILRGLLRVLLVLVLLGAALLAVLFRRKRILQRFGTLPVRAVFYRFLAMSHAYSYLPGRYGQEEGFAQELAAAFPSLSNEEAERFVDILMRSAFAEEEASEEEAAEVRKVYRTCAREIEGKLNVFRKGIFWYLQVYL